MALDPLDFVDDLWWATETIVINPNAIAYMKQTERGDPTSYKQYPPMVPCVEVAIIGQPDVIPLYNMTLADVFDELRGRSQAAEREADRAGENEGR